MDRERLKRFLKRKGKKPHVIEKNGKTWILPVENYGVKIGNALDKAVDILSNANQDTKKLEKYLEKQNSKIDVIISETMSS